MLKVLSPDVTHKTDAGGVQVDLRSEQEVSEAYSAIFSQVEERHPSAAIEGILVESFQKTGQETIIGMSTDVRCGPILMFGLGGIYVEALKDVSFRVYPVTNQIINLVLVLEEG